MWWSCDVGLKDIIVCAQNLTRQTENQDKNKEIIIRKKWLKALACGYVLPFSTAINLIHNFSKCSVH